MTEESKKLKDYAVNGMIWSALGKFGTKIITFVSNMVLARLLMPKDFGCIGMIQVFLTIADVLIVSGFASALIQKKNVTDTDCSTVFHWNLSMSIFLYSVLFVTAPAISRMYSMLELCGVLRVQGIVLIINSFSVIQTNNLIRALDFKSLSIRNVISSLTGTIVAIVMALLGFGVWSLVGSSLTSSIIGVILLWNLSKWRPSFTFSFKSFKELFAFGGLLAASSIVSTVYNELQSLIIGKKYTAQDLGYYTQARALESVPTQTLTQIVNQVSFPVFSKLQDDYEKLKIAIGKNIKSLTYIVFPMNVMFILTAKPLLHLLYGSNWDPSILYFQLLCITAMFMPINNTNTNIIKALGKGKTYFTVHLTYKVIGIIAIIVGVQFGIIGILCGVIFTTFITYLISSCVIAKILDYRFYRQIKNISTNLVLSLVSGLFCYYLPFLFNVNEYIVMLLQICLYLMIYIVVSKISHLEAFDIYSSIIKNKLTRFRK